MDLAERLRGVVELAVVELRLIKNEDAGVRHPPKWSRKEILGHLIDSACNNHRRFLMAQTDNHLIFDGYQQDAWVRMQNYNERDWNAIIDLWRAYNLHLAHLIFQIPDEIKYRIVNQHNLDEISFHGMPKAESTTLSYFIADYIDHVKHHLVQIGEFAQ